jgi:hypothetical protein
MKRFFSTIVLFAIFAYISPGQNTMIYEGKIVGRKYSSKVIGWSINIPKYWDTNSPANLVKDQKKTYSFLKKMYGNNIDTCGLYLTGFQKNRSSFFAVAQPFKGEGFGT